MNWDALGAIAELVGAIGVIATLAYLSLQIRRSTSQAKADALIKMNEVVRDFSYRIADDSSLAKLVLEAGQDWNSVSAKDQFKVHLYNMQEVWAYEAYYFMLRNKQIEEETYLSREGHIARRLSAPGARHWWENYAYNIDPGFVKRINERIANPESLGAMADVSFFDPKNWEASHAPPNE